MRQAIMALAGFAIVAPLAFLFSSESSQRPDTITSRNGVTSGPRPSQSPRESTILRPERQFNFRLADYGQSRAAIPSETEPSTEESVIDVDETETPSDPAAELEYATALQWNAASLFELLDANADGQLTGSEIPSILRKQLGSHTSIDPSLFVAMFQATVLEPEVIRGASAPVPASRSIASLDTDGDGRVGPYKWRAADRSPAEFRRLDADGDGFLSPREMQAVAPPAANNPTATPFASNAALIPSLSQGGVPAPGQTPSSVDNLFAGFVYRAVQANPAPSAAKPTVVASKPNPIPAQSAVARTASSPIARPAPVRVAAAPQSAPVAAAAPAPVAIPASSITLDDLASMPLPLTGNSHWELRDQMNCMTLMSGVRPNVLFLGDSITEVLGYYSGEPLWQEYFAPLGSVNFGIAGIGTSEILWQIQRGEVAYAAPRVIVLCIGSNNLAAGQSPEAVAAGVAKILDELHDQLPRTRVLLIGMLPRMASATNNPFRTLIPRANALIAPLADGDRVTYIDIGNAFLSADGSISPDLMPDQLHPSLLGYEIYTAGVYPVLLNLLQRP